MSPSKLNILAIEPYLSAARRDFLEGLRSTSRHSWTLLTLPARSWQWRMQASAIHFADQIKGLGRRPFNLLFVTDFVNLCDLLALVPAEIGRLPAVVYFHENRFPRLASGKGGRDYQSAGHAFSHITTAAAAREVWFNSHHHSEQFLSSAEAILKSAPDGVPAGLVASIRSRCRTMPPGLDLQPLVAGQKKDRSGPLTILWNHRWEKDKNPEEFFSLLFLLADEGYPFRLSVVGETLRRWPPVFERARKRLGARVIQFGYLPNRADYIQTVKKADVVISTAIHEYFGLQVIEAIAAGLYPLLPDRLCYPEIIPAQWHKVFLYKDQRALRSRLIRLLQGKADWKPSQQLARQIQSYDWHNLAKKYDDALERVAASA